MNHYNFNTEPTNLYQILEIEQTADTETIRKSYKKLSLKYHPDKQIKTNLSEEEKTMQFIKIRDAYEILSDSTKRQKYDRELMNYKNIYRNFDDVIHDLKNMLSTKEYMTFMNILDNKIKQTLLNSVKIDDLLIQINQMNLIDVFQKINNFRVLDIEINLDFTLYELYNNIYQVVKYSRITNKLFEEIIYPIDSKQIYENEGETIKINNVIYCGNFIVNINIKNTIYYDINYQILEKDLYASVSKNLFLQNDTVEIKFLDGKIHKINMEKIEKIITDFGFLYCVPNMGLPYYDTNKDVIDIEHCDILRGKLFLLMT